MRVAKDQRSDKSEISSNEKIPTLAVSANPTSFPTKGSLAYDTVTDKIYFGTDAAWLPVGGTGGDTIDMFDDLPLPVTLGAISDPLITAAALTCYNVSVQSPKNTYRSLRWECIMEIGTGTGPVSITFPAIPAPADPLLPFVIGINGGDGVDLLKIRGLILSDVTGVISGGILTINIPPFTDSLRTQNFVLDIPAIPQPAGTYIFTAYQSFVGQ